ncbi:tRNA U34 carboxymethyltransferase [Thalassocella blandensis]|nr:tRNA U34 carboxymethyltransferase [Thalassocella blandensis]
MIDYSSFIESIRSSKLKPWAEQLPEQIAAGLSTQRYGDLPGWYDALNALPNITPSQVDLRNEVKIGTITDAIADERQQLEIALRNLIPWRKGPYNIFDVHIDTEWRSDWKWDRVLEHISPLADRNILDVGCGNGYHCLRMLGEKARRVIGIDPSPRFVVQFYMLKKYLDLYCQAQQQDTFAVDVLPVGIEALPENLQAFDTTFSMGVLYHRRSPFDHLRELKDTLVPGGELVLETLIIEGKLGDTLVPEDRYAKMNNVWFLPSAETLISWLKKVGFTNIRCVDNNVTSLQEQRVTDWMQYQSLEDFLHPEDKSLTAEGHPAPMRGVFVAQKPR